MKISKTTPLEELIPYFAELALSRGLDEQPSTDRQELVARIKELEALPVKNTEGEGSEPGTDAGAGDEGTEQGTDAGAGDEGTEPATDADTEDDVALVNIKPLCSIRCSHKDKRYNIDGNSTSVAVPASLADDLVAGKYAVLI